MKLARAELRDTGIVGTNMPQESVIMSKTKISRLIFSSWNCFILVRVAMDSEPILETLDTLDGRQSTIGHSVHIFTPRGYVESLIHLPLLLKSWEDTRKPRGSSCGNGALHRQSPSLGLNQSPWSCKMARLPVAPLCHTSQPRCSTML